MKKRAVLGPRVINEPWYGFDHKKVFERYRVDRYVGSFSIPCAGGDNIVWEVFRAPKPDKSKGHKKYVLLRAFTDAWTGQRKAEVSGIHQQRMRYYRYQDGLLCSGCNTVAVSAQRHHACPCECGKNSIDGGRAYTHLITQEGAPPAKVVTIDWLTMTIVKGKVKA